MYAVMTPLCVLLGVADLLFMPHVIPTPLAFGFALGLTIVSFLSYRGAVSVAAEYGTVLQAINEEREASSASKR